MNTLTLRIQSRPDDDGSEVRILIDGRDLPEQDGTGRAAVLACECGELGCWPLHVWIRMSNLVVTWSRFAQPYRPAWRHDGLRPFTFERAAYEQAIRDVTP